MRHTNTKGFSLGAVVRLLGATGVAAGALCASTAQGAVPGITGPTFNLNAGEAFISQPDGQSIYSWGYGCTAGSTPSFAPAAISGTCSPMQIPGPTLIVHQGDTVAVTLTNHLPQAAGNTSIMFPGFQVCAATLNTDGTCTGTATGVPGLLTQEAAHNGTVTYKFVATTEGTHSYFSGTQGDLQVEMGLYGAIIVLPTSVPSACAAVGSTPTTGNRAAEIASGETDFRLAASAYSHSSTCYDREYLFQFSEIDPKIHRAAEEIAKCTAGPGISCPSNMNAVETEPYKPAYFMINGRSMPDNMDPHYAVQYPRQPYNGNPHMHPGELTLLRVIGQGRWQHPFHEHGNHVRVLARDGNLLLAPNLVSAETEHRLAGPLLFTTTTTPGQALDGIFYWTGRGLNWDVFGHMPGELYTDTQPQFASYFGTPVVCTPDANGYYTADPGAPNYYEWCGDHNKPLEKAPFGQVGSGGPVTLPDPNIVANGPWYGGSPYLGGDATTRAVGSTPIPPSGTVANSPTDEAGFAYMWHSHNEREITTNNIFPGGMLMMMLVDPRAFKINEAN
jgi:FtsP/CotA-like multicopper oxidase with cupredoxin domain